MTPLKGRIALVTGASRGIGVHIARALAREGMHLVLAARSGRELRTVAADIAGHGVRTLAVPTDVARPAALRRLVRRCADFGGVDVLVNNAALEHAAPFDRIEPEWIDRILDVNLRAPIALTHALLPAMIERGRGHVVNVASIAGLLGVPYAEAYAATKHGILGFTRSLRATALGEGYPVGFSAVCPGFVSEAGMYEAYRRRSGIESPAWFGTSSPEAVADAVIRSIVDDVSEIVVNPTPIRPFVALTHLFPELGEWITARTGAIEIFRQVAVPREANEGRDPSEEPTTRTRRKSPPRGSGRRAQGGTGSTAGIRRSRR